MSYAELFSELKDAKARVKATPSAADFGLSEEQYTALCAPLTESAIICAGAGAGKTKLLVERVARLLKAGVSPKRLAVVTFTRKAAKEMLTRISAKLPSQSMPVCGTVHSLALSHLLRCGATPTIAQPEQELAGVAELIDYLPDDYSDLSPSELLLKVNCVREQEDYGGVDGLLARAYEMALGQEGLQDFTGLLKQGLEYPADLFDHVLVDETQDLSHLQLQFLRAIAPRARFWFIGDPDQSIYSFRGAYSSMMHQLQSEYGKTYWLTTNYRCAKRILTHANNVISFNKDRFDVKWVPARKDEGSVEVLNFPHGEHELAFALDWVMQAPERRSVLARTQKLVEPFKNAGLPGFTVHESKGLEWPEVLVIGCEGGLFPHPLAPKDEERRLFYVAMTRAKNKLLLSYCANRSHKNPQKVNRHPSVFLFETQALEAKT